jgi:ribonuclease HI
MMIEGPVLHDLLARVSRLATELALWSTPDPAPPLKPGRYLLNTDASVRQGGSVIGGVLSDPDDRVVATYVWKIESASIPEAEYMALIAGLQLARERKVTKLRAYLDNEAVVDQVNRATAKGVLKELHGAAKQMLGEFQDSRVYWVPRERNKAADTLVGRALLNTDPLWQLTSVLHRHP